MTPKDPISNLYEREHHRNLLFQQAEMQRLYEAAIDRIYVCANGITLAEGEIFDITRYPLLNAAIEREVAALASQVQVSIENGIRRSFDLSTRKIAAQVNATYYQNRTMDSVIQEIINRPQGGAMDAFIKRKSAGLDLSQRVFKYTEAQFKAEIEQNLFAGIAEGKPAVAMARDQKQYLQQPDRLFRRVRDAEGKLRLSKAAKAYHPGQGVYRSSYKNALRLTVNETNMAYRKADIDRYRQTQFITGYRVILSRAHKTFDICDYLSEQNYPLDFEWVLWHPNCLCACIPIMPDLEEFKQYQQALLRGEGDTFKFKNVVKDVPEAFKQYVDKNRETFDSWKRLPYWMANNRKFTAVAG